ncbi:MAG: fibronectin type III domain-containing protein [Eubacterium sp.]|nr:fibronectin type III domain-containing protein [Eubacterium sp.]
MLFFLGTSVCAFADELPDPYGISTATEHPAITQSLEPLELMQADIAEKSFTVTAEKVGAKHAVLKWESSELFLSYTLCRLNIITGKWDEVLTTASTKARLSGLNENTRYKYAVMNSADGEILGTVDFKTAAKRAEVTAKSLSSKYVELKIKNVKNDSLVEVYRSSDNKHFKKIGKALNGKFKDENVKKETDYYYRVRCYRRRGRKLIVSRRSTTLHVKTLKPFALPKDTDGECKTYAIYTAVTATGSPQYHLLHSDKCYTDEETGIRMVDGYYCVALGSFYGTKIGTKYKVTLQAGDKVKEINVILCDQKSDRHTNSTHQYAMRNKDVVEFYVEKAKIPSGIRGDYGTTEKFSGKIIAIEQYTED